MKAVEPSRQGTVERAGAVLHYDIYGKQSDPTVLLLPTWEIVDSRAWKMQIGFLSRYFRVVVYDAAGTGQSSAPCLPSRYTHSHRIADAVAVLDATDTTSAVVAGVSRGGELALYLAALHPERVNGLLAIAPSHAWRVLPNRGDYTLRPGGQPHPRGMGKGRPCLLEGEPRRFPRLLHPAGVLGPALHKGDRGLRCWALEQRPDVLTWSVTVHTTTSI